jgi:uroporphyrin-III C-methyltransferase/precorrin-2 dehydrogenase/sirohydrochlorin ferrochelatase
VTRSPYLPAFHDLRGARVLVVGAGRVAARRIEALISRGADVTVVAKALSPPVRALAAEGRVRRAPVPFVPGLLEGVHLVFAATSDRAANAAVAREARRRNIPVNAADAPSDCSFILPAVTQGDGFVLAVSTEGKNPGAARSIREFLDDRREEIAVRLERGRRRLGLRARPGRVYIVGAGPGDPDLLTVRALGLLRGADVVIHDYLVPDAILSLRSPRARTICYARKGRTAAHGSALKQSAIHEAMVRLAREGRSVVRLKSGDPLVFGRGGEEAEFLARAGVPFEIVPGITAAVGCAAAAGVPLTHRDLASSVTFVAGHESDGKAEPAVEWDRLPRGGTIAVYMGVSRIREVARDLAKAGLSPETPFVLVENGTRRGERIVRGTLAGLPGAAEDAGVRSPAILFVGKAAAAATVSRAGEESEDGPVAKSV